jgi:hypothetical protein
MLKRFLAASAAVIFAAAQALAAGAFIPAASPAAPADWHPMPLGGVGYTTGIYFANDGTGVLRTDAGGNWIKSPGAPGTHNWRPLLNPNNTYDARATPDLGPLNLRQRLL